MAIEVVGVAPLIQVFHMPTAIRFYRDMLGFTVTGNSKSMSEDPDDVNWVMLELGGAEVMLNTAYDPDDVPENRMRRGGAGIRIRASTWGARMWTGHIGN
jgi:glyoxylase I family protein